MVLGLSIYKKGFAEVNNQAIAVGVPKRELGKQRKGL